MANLKSKLDPEDPVVQFYGLVDLEEQSKFYSW